MIGWENTWTSSWKILRRLDWWFLNLGHSQLSMLHGYPALLLFSHLNKPVTFCHFCTKVANITWSLKEMLPHQGLVIDWPLIMLSFFVLIQKDRHAAIPVHNLQHVVLSRFLTSLDLKMAARPNLTMLTQTKWPAGCWMCSPTAAGCLAKQRHICF